MRQEAHLGLREPSPVTLRLLVFALCLSGVWGGGSRAAARAHVLGSELDTFSPMPTVTA